ncbi:NAD(P)H-hydrate dehydratase [Helicobacter baculiformis]|uniref:NAD(P)H-hydrate epimerase n=1 Tax=Helicobacter baculiformis TaxID=427351 RepID=A0ABV7ZEL3_9HELI|nr:NAD(P)H-hydrate dehydratase [Helicobacter baculiformis]
MQFVYSSTRELDTRAQERFVLSAELLMENAAMALQQAIYQYPPARVLVVCGSGDNGGDGYALARRLQGSAYEVCCYAHKPPKSALCQVQFDRALRAGVLLLEDIEPCGIVMDCLYGSGFKGELRAADQALIARLNALEGVKIACDVPSGLDSQGRIGTLAFKADKTISMGALKAALFSDMAKDFVGEIVVGDLGVGRGLYEEPSDLLMLEEQDLILPVRSKHHVHKGYFGHVCVGVGVHSGAGLLCALAALRFGAGLVSVLGDLELARLKPLELMYARDVPPQANAFALGMGMGEVLPPYAQAMLEQGACVLDADMFYTPTLKEILEQYHQLVLTPHPKEFVGLLRAVGFEVELPQVLQSRLEYLHAFSQAYPHIVVLLKGANPYIAHHGQIYINPLGAPSLAKAGSGDVLAGMVASLLAQGYSPLDAALNASLAHALIGRAHAHSYALTPLTLMSHLSHIGV